jgi:hypothetical protein
MLLGNPITKALVSRLEPLITGYNELIKKVFLGTAPHKVNDVTNVIVLGEAPVSAGLDAVIDLGQELITKYEAHIASTTHHIGADSTNVVTELGVPIEVYTLLNELKVDYEAHRVLTAASVHAGADATNTITAANATTKALAVALANDLVETLQANFVNVTSHHGGDGDEAGATALAALNGGDPLDAESTWEEIALVADGIRAAYEAHRVLTAGSVHGAADSTNTVTAGAVGTIQTAVNAGLNELKGDFNAHIATAGSVHYITDRSMEVTAANASSLATSRTLVNAIRAGYVDHITYADELALAPVIPGLDQEV